MNTAAVTKRGSVCRCGLWATSLIWSAGFCFPVAGETLFHSISFTGGRVVLMWSSSPGNVYEVQTRDAADLGNWNTVTSFVANALPGGTAHPDFAWWPASRPSAAGQATGKRQHVPIRARAYYD